ncbi:MAG: hypothetical protein HY717_00450 [Planctomycetes bacterium]|nr:hypothetical protein [Planctomycetota bacterium]
MRTEDPHIRFVGRRDELSRIRAILEGKESAILIVYGRRRVGKTALIEKALLGRRVFRFEGISGASQGEQIRSCLDLLSKYISDPKLAKLAFRGWREFFDLLADYCSTGNIVLYFEEVQWIANYREDFCSQLKPIWDNRFSRNQGLVLILCGSSPSFVITKVIRSQALYGRSQHSIFLEPFSLEETCEYLGSRRSLSEILDGYLSVGGIPEYLKYLKMDSSIYLSLCRSSFTHGGYFLEEYEKVFVSSLARNPGFRKIIDLLAKKRFASRLEIAAHLKLSPGGGLSDLLDELELCGFIESYCPYSTRKEASKLKRFSIADSYLNFYYKFIKPLEARIKQGEFKKRPEMALNRHSFRTWLGLVFERFCRRRSFKIAEILGFSGVEYRCGPYFKRADKQGAQVDLVFDRKDRVLTVCEIKYQDSPVTKNVIPEFEAKLSLVNLQYRSLQKVLIAPRGAEQKVADYFDKVIELEEIRNW